MTDKSKRIVVNGEVRMDTVAVFSEKGIKVEACPWMDKEADEVVPDGRVRMKGFSIIEPGARMFFKPYNIGSRGNRYRTLFSTEHCEVMRSGGGVVIEKWRFGKRMTLEDILTMRHIEGQRINAFYKSRKESTVW